MNNKNEKKLTLLNELIDENLCELINHPNSHKSNRIDPLKTHYVIKNLLPQHLA